MPELELQGRFVTCPIATGCKGVHSGLAWQVQQGEPWHTYGFLVSGITAILAFGLPGLVSGAEAGGVGLGCPQSELLPKAV